MEPGQPTPRPQSLASSYRLSTLYEYHSAPEVAPAHGLEYDDTIYPTSDKCPVVNQHSDPPPYTGSYDPTAKSPRIIFGMKVRMFIIVAILFICIIVGAAVGGAIGGRNMHGGSSSNELMNGDSSLATSTTSAAPQTVVASATATPTYTPLSDCPACNDTTYSSTYSETLAFTKHCNVESPLSDSTLSVTNITEAFVYSFDDCIEICASYNHYGSSRNCTVAIYSPTASRPADCWIGVADLKDTRNLRVASGIAVALLNS